MKKLIVFIALSMTCFLSANAQIGTQAQNFTNHPRAYTTRYSMWEETNLQGSIDSTQRWQYQIDLQWRRMADASWTKGDPGSNTSNIMKNPYQYVVRPWIHYWIVPQRVRLSLSPIGFWETYTPAVEAVQAGYTNGDDGSKATHKQTVQPEFRICPQVTVNNQIGRLLVVMRYRYEFQFKGNRMPSTTDFWNDLGEGYSFYPTGIGQSGHYGSTHQGRFRWQTRAQMLLNSNKMQANTVYINAWNELFLSMGRHVDLTKTVNQNRLVAMVGWKLPTAFPIRVEAGVTFQTSFVYSVSTNGYGQTYTTPGGTGNPNGPVLSGYTGSRQVENNVAYTVYVIFDEFHTMFKKKRPQDEPKFPHPEKL